MEVRDDYAKPFSETNKTQLPMISSSAARTADGKTLLSLVNVDLDNAKEVSVKLDGISAKSVTGTILTSKNATDYNDFTHPETVKPAAFKDAKLKNGVLTVKLPKMSIVVLEVR